MEKTKILIVEDETITALFISECLDNLGYDVIDSAITASDAIDIAEELSPDLVLMDIMLIGEMTGIEAAEIIYRRFDIPVVYLTAYSDKNTLDKAKLTGSFGYLLKPVEEKSLRPVIEMAISKHRQESELKNKNQWLNTVVKSINNSIIATDTSGKIRFINPETEEITGWKNNELIGKQLEEIIDFGENILKNNIFDNYSKKGFIKFKNGQKKPNNFNISYVKDSKANIYGYIISFSLIEKNPKKLISISGKTGDLTNNLDGMIGICSFCKKIRDDKNQWERLEEFIQSRFNIMFSHGVCPDCSKKYYS